MTSPFKNPKFRHIPKKQIPLAELLKLWRITARKINDIDEVAQETEGST